MSASSSLVHEVGRHAGGIQHVPSTQLPVWLPALTIPARWTAGIVNGAHVTRLLLRGSDIPNQWGGCEVLNLYRVAAFVPRALIVDHVASTLRGGEATGVEVSVVDVPRRYGIFGAHAAGSMRSGGRDVHGQFRYYAINSAGGSALVEQSVMVGAELRDALAGEVAGLTEHLLKCLLASMDRPHDPRP